MITPMAAPAIKTATTLRLPRSPATVAGNPKIPLPIIEFTMSAARLHRPMARTKLVCLGPLCVEDIAKPFVSQPARSWTKVLQALAETLETARPARFLT
jgi:hypothetical protein